MKNPSDLTITDIRFADIDGAPMNIHMAESPIAAFATVHVAVGTRNFMALKINSVDVPWWKNLVVSDAWDKEWANDRRWS